MMIDDDDDDDHLDLFSDIHGEDFYYLFIFTHRRNNFSVNNFFSREKTRSTST